MSTPQSRQTDRYNRWRSWATARDLTTATIIAKSIIYGIRNGEGEPAWGSKTSRDDFMGWCGRTGVLFMEGGV